MAMFFVQFVKSATLADGKEVEDLDRELKEDGGGSDDGEDDEEERAAKAKVLNRLTDEEMLRACDGMTAHK